MKPKFENNISMQAKYYHNYKLFKDGSTLNTNYISSYKKRIYKSKVASLAVNNGWFSRWRYKTFLLREVCKESFKNNNNLPLTFLARWAINRGSSTRKVSCGVGVFQTNALSPSWE